MLSTMVKPRTSQHSCVVRRSWHSNIEIKETFSGIHNNLASDCETSGFEKKIISQTKLGFGDGEVRAIYGAHDSRQPTELVEVRCYGGNLFPFWLVDFCSQSDVHGAYHFPQHNRLCASSNNKEFTANQQACPLAKFEQCASEADDHRNGMAESCIPSLDCRCQ